MDPNRQVWDIVWHYVNPAWAITPAVWEDVSQQEMNMAVQSITDLVNTVASLDTVIASALALINGINQRINDAITAALQGGATAADLAPLTQLNADLTNQSQALAQAVANNTPPAPAPTP